MYRFSKDSFVTPVATVVSATTCLLVFTIIAFLLLESREALSSIGFPRFFADSSWHPESEAIDGLFGIWPMIAGTLLTSALAVIIATPLGVLSAVFSQFYAPKPLGALFRRVVELLAGIPSVVYGLWGLVVLVPYMQRFNSSGVGIVTAAIVLGIMIIPTIALSCRSALASIASEHQNTASALGLGKTASIIKVFLPLAKGTIAVGVLLATARAIGETMVVVMLCGNVVKLPGGIFDATRTLTATIALEMGYSYGDHRSALFAIGLFLMTGVLSILIVVRTLRGSSAYESAK